MQNNIKHSVYIETYGCQMNINDTGIIHRIMLDNNYSLTDNISEATIIFINTCAVREHAERRVYNRIITISHLIKKSKYKIILGILGCMAERLKENLFSFNPFIDLIVGPDEYKKLPTLIENCFEKYLKDIAVSSNNLEDYGDIIPVNKSSISSFISIMRGCNNFCSYCVVPYTRGRERSRSNLSIIKEIEYLVSNSIKEIYLLGQNVNSYSFNEIDFSQLLGNIAKNFSNIWIRFLTSHPKNMSINLIETIAQYDNICNYFHLPVQSGSNRILKLMNRNYQIENYIFLVKNIKNKIKNCAISTDIITGYPSETLADHNATISLLKEIRFSNAFMFRYSPREGTRAFKQIDDVPEDKKIRRLNEIITLQNSISKEENLKEINSIVEILVDNQSKKKPTNWFGKTKTSKVVVFENSSNCIKLGDVIKVRITKATSATLTGELVKE